MSTKSPIQLYFLQASRSIRIAWLLEELKVPYDSHFFPRIENKAPADFKEKSGYVAFTFFPSPILLSYHLLPVGKVMEMNRDGNDV